MAMTRAMFKTRIWSAVISRHNGNQDSLGQPTYDVEADWLVILPRWPCELLSTGGGEKLRGRQVSANTTHVLIGEWAAVDAAGVGPDCRIVIRNNTYSITAVLDPDGLNREMRIEARRSWST